MVTSLDVRLLGPFDLLTSSGDSLLPKGRKAVGILAYLAFHKDQPIPRMRLISLFWPDREIEQGQGSLRQCLREIRQALSGLGRDVLHATRNTVMFESAGVAFDLWDGADQIVFDNPAWFLDGLVTKSKMFDAWVNDTRRYVRSRQVRAAEQAVNAVDVLQQTAQAIGFSRQAIALDPTHEPAVRVLITALAKQDQLPLAKQAYEALDEVLARDGFEISSATKTLYQTLRSQPLAPGPVDPGPLPAGQIPVIQIQPNTSAAVDPSYVNMTETLADICMERLVQLPELRILDAREGSAATSPQDHGYFLRCKISGGAQAPVCHLHLTDTQGNEVIWSTRQPLDADRIYDELPVVADIVASSVLTVVERREHTRLRLRNAPPETAYQYYLEAKDIFFRADQPDYVQLVEQRLEHARTLDPLFEPAYTHLIQSYNSMRFLSEPGRDFRPGRDRALTLARKLLAINAQHPNAHIAMAWCQIWRKNYALAERHIDRAMALGAYESHRLNAIGTALVYLGRLEEGEACYDQAQDRMLHEFEYQRTDYGELRYLQGAFEDALSWLQTGERHAPFRSSLWRALAHAQLGQLVQARQALDDMVQSAAPQWRGDQPITATRLISWYMDGLPLRRQVDVDLLMDGLRKAGVTLALAEQAHPQ